MKYLYLLSILAFLLTACANPNWTPDGYSWHDSTPISSPANTSGWNNKIEGKPLDRTQSLDSVISGVSADIVDSLELRLSRSTPVYMMPLEINNFTSLLDHGLRENLAKRGYTLSSTPVDAYSISYNIEPTQRKEASASTYDFTLWDMAQEEPVLIETRTQELPTSAHGG